MVTSLTLNLSPTGNDHNDGMEYSPLKSINEAQTRAREIIAQQNHSPDTKEIIVLFQAGKYVIDKPLVFSAADGGNNNLKVIYKAQKDVNVVISGE